MNKELDELRGWIQSAGLGAGMLYAGFGSLAGMSHLLEREPREKESDRIFAEMAEHARIALHHMENASHFAVVVEATSDSWKESLRDYADSPTGTIASAEAMVAQRNASVGTYRAVSGRYHALCEHHRACAEDARLRYLAAVAEEKGVDDRLSRRLARLRELGCHWDRCESIADGERCGGVGVFFVAPVLTDSIALQKPALCEACVGKLPSPSTDVIDPLDIPKPRHAWVSVPSGTEPSEVTIVVDDVPNLRGLVEKLHEKVLVRSIDTVFSHEMTSAPEDGVCVVAIDMAADRPRVFGYEP